MTDNLKDALELAGLQMKHGGPITVYGANLLASALLAAQARLTELSAENEQMSAVTTRFCVACGTCEKCDTHGVCEDTTDRRHMWNRYEAHDHEVIYDLRAQIGRVQRLLEDSAGFSVTERIEFRRWLKEQINPDAAQSRLTRIEEALRPFAEAAAGWESVPDDRAEDTYIASTQSNTPRYPNIHVSVADLRNARRALDTPSTPEETQP